MYMNGLNAAGDYNQYGDYVPASSAGAMTTGDTLYTAVPTPSGVAFTATTGTGPLGLPATIGGINTKILLVGLVLAALYLYTKKRS